MIEETLKGQHFLVFLTDKGIFSKNAFVTNLSGESFSRQTSELEDFARWTFANERSSLKNLKSFFKEI